MAAEGGGAGGGKERGGVGAAGQGKATNDKSRRRGESGSSEQEPISGDGGRSQPIRGCCCDR